MLCSLLFPPVVLCVSVRLGSPAPILSTHTLLHTHSVPRSSGPEQHRDSYWGDVCWHCGLQEQSTDQLFPMVSDTHTNIELHASVCKSTT